MLLSLMYHHINSDKYSNSLELLDKHFEYISQNYQTIFPNEYKKNTFATQLCLVFDDAFYDFYYYAFPLLKKYKIKAILSVPTKYIIDTTNIKSEKRLNLKHSDIMYDKKTLDLVPFCTWKELKEMSDSKYVQIASHSVNHINLTKCHDEELELELKKSKEIIEDKLSIKCDIFTYPYGAFDKKVKQMVKKYYNFDIAIGAMYNFSVNSTIRRINADNLKHYSNIFNNKNKIKYFINLFRIFIKNMNK